MSLPQRRISTRHASQASPIVDNGKKRKLEQLGDDLTTLDIPHPPSASSPRRGRSAGLQSPPMTPTRRILSPWNKKNELTASLDALKTLAQAEDNLLTNDFTSLLQGDTIDHRALGNLAKNLFDVFQQRLVVLQSLASCCLDRFGIFLTLSFPVS